MKETWVKMTLAILFLSATVGCRGQDMRVTPPAQSAVDENTSQVFLNPVILMPAADFVAPEISVARAGGSANTAEIGVIARLRRTLGADDNGHMTAYTRIGDDIQVRGFYPQEEYYTTNLLDFCSTLAFELDANSDMRPFLRLRLRGEWDSGSRHSCTPK